MKKARIQITVPVAENRVDCMTSGLSINENALQIVQNLIEAADDMGCRVVDAASGTTLVDAGIEVPGSVEAGRLIARICMGGLAAVRVVPVHIGDMTVQAAMVATQEPAITTLGSQLARWKVSHTGYSAMGSGPARAKAGIERKLFDDIGYVDEGDGAVLVLEAQEYPPEKVLESVAETCDVSPANLHCVVVPTASIAGSVQIAARIVEIGIYRLYRLGMKPVQFRGGFGVAPFPIQVNDDNLAMGASNDCLAYGGRAHFFVASEGMDLEDMARKACSGYSESYGRSFSELYEDAGREFYGMDQQLFSPAQISIMDIDAEEIYRAGEINVAMVGKALSHV